MLKCCMHHLLSLLGIKTLALCFVPWYTPFFQAQVPPFALSIFAFFFGLHVLRSSITSIINIAFFAAI